VCRCKKEKRRLKLAAQGKSVRPTDYRDFSAGFLYPLCYSTSQPIHFYKKVRPIWRKDKKLHLIVLAQVFQKRS
jgi:murein endopeptidase